MITNHHWDRTPVQIPHIQDYARHTPVSANGKGKNPVDKILRGQTLGRHKLWGEISRIPLKSIELKQLLKILRQRCTFAASIWKSEKEIENFNNY